MQSLKPVLEAAPATLASASNGGLILQLADGALVLDPVKAAPAECLAAFDYEPAFDVIAYTAIAARKPRDRYDYEGRAHSLWFCDAHDEGIYRWYELAFMAFAHRYTTNPLALPPTDKDAAAAFSPVMHVYQVAWQPIPFDQGEEEHFVERWLEWLAAAADGSLSHPSSMPANSGGRHRSSRGRRPCR